MRILNLEKLAKEEDTVGLILDEVVEDIKIVDDYARKLKDNLCNNPEANKIAQSKLTGAFNGIRTALSVVATAKRNKELTSYYEEKEQLESESKKFNASATKEKVMAQTNEWRRVRNYLEAYKEATEKDIITLQSMLKDTNREQGHHTE